VLDLHRLRLLRELKHRGTLAAVAEALPLLERAGRRVRLTPAAERLVEHTMEPSGTAARHWATAVCRAAGFEPDVRYQSTDLLLHLRLVRTGHAVALLPALLPSDPAIHLSDLPGSPARRIYAATRRGASRQPALSAVQEALAAAIQARPRPMIPEPAPPHDPHSKQHRITP
jgi:DNA-binding transcriptional LysR family regulator